jgi:3-hydroxybenzoate 6-monooxygenase
VSQIDVVVVGGGIGGLANACALAAAGHSVRVLERAADFSEVGAGLQMAPNATRILRSWGLLDEVLAAGVAPARLVFRDALDGSGLTYVDLRGDFPSRYAAPYVVIHRSDLLDILVGACTRAGVELVAGSAVEEVVSGEDGVLVRSATGEHAARIAIGADGLHSTLRARLSPDEPICSGYVAYRGTSPIGSGDSLDDVVVYIGPGRHLVQYPLRGGELLNTVAVFQSPAYRRGEAKWGGQEELDVAFAASCPAVLTGLGRLWRDRHWPMYDRLPIDRWVDGRLALTGDAAHPMLQYLAQGACQAIEDAHALATHVRRHAPDWDRALHEYEAERVPRTAHVQTTARFWGDIWHVDGVARVLRNELFRTRDLSDYRYMDWLYAG